MINFAFFPTQIGTCAIAWGENGVLAVQLPERDEARLRLQITKRWRGAIEAPPSDDVNHWIVEMTALLAGEARDLGDIHLDMAEVPEFNQRVYAVARKIPPGSTRTYGEIAKELGDPLLARAVGQALGQNPFPIVVPCHRVLAANRLPGGFSAPGGTHTKVRMLAIEGVDVGEQMSLF
jgi:methylated-DNA-[protein]-cysteine S-methyltransferase